MHTGSATVPMPSLAPGSATGWARSTATCPLTWCCAEHMPYAGAQVWDNSFLPPEHQGVRIVPGKEPIPDLHSTVSLRCTCESWSGDAPRRQRAVRQGPPGRPGPARAHGQLRDGSRHDAQAPEVFDLAGKPKRRMRLYGLAAGDRISFAAQCLTARRLVGTRRPRGGADRHRLQATTGMRTATCRITGPRLAASISRWPR